MLKIMIRIQSAFVIFLVLLGLEILLVDCSCNHKTTTKIKLSSSKVTTRQKTTTSTIIPTSQRHFVTINYDCTDAWCEEFGKQFCICPKNNYRNRSTHWPVPKNDFCPSIGCSPAGEECMCYRSYICGCNDISQCNRTECKEMSLSSGCYCYFGDREIRTYGMPASQNCSDLLREIGDHNGLYQCSAFSCNCDHYGDCICTPPQNKNLQTTRPKKCDYKECKKRSFEFCHCTHLICP